MSLKTIFFMPLLRSVATLFLSAVAAVCCASPYAPKVNALLREVDAAIAHHAEYVSRKQSRIKEVRQALAEAQTAGQRYDLSFRLYEEYVSFSNDSAMIYLQRCRQIAAALGDSSRAGRCQSLMAFGYSNAGLYVEALSTLNGVNESQLRGEDLGYYYCAYTHVCHEVAYYTHADDVRRRYSAEADRYRNLMYQHLPANNRNVWLNREGDFMDKGDYKSSKHVNDEWLAVVDSASHDFAYVALYRYLEYKHLRDTTTMMTWLAASVLTDVRNGVLDQGSMWELANELAVHGDLDRSYRYICFASDCARRYGSPQRLSRIAPLLSDIAMQYKDKSQRSEGRLRRTAIAVGVLAFLLMCSLFYVDRQRRRLAAAHGHLAENNRKLSALNASLTEANRVKDEYVGRFMRFCSIYVNKIDDLRKMVSRKLKNKQYDELYELTRSQKFVETEMDELYANFDTAFLHLFPTFVEEFNALLQPEHRIPLDDDGRLSTILRIFALIRLGITDSGKIAEFLHYSVNTIYNYRASTKSHALVDRNEFEARVREIGGRFAPVLENDDEA